ncbi:MAG: substrate-binding domain-containing protein, partial [Flavitalea sp.]
DKAVICFDDHDIFRLYSPGITTICQPIEEIGSTAVKLLISKISQSPRLDDSHVVSLGTRLLVRGSTARKADDKLLQ